MAFCFDNAWRDASLERWNDAGIEEACRWNGKEGKMSKALRNAGFLDGFIVHGWLENAGKLVNDRLRIEAKRNKEKSQKAITSNNVENSRRQSATLYDKTSLEESRVEESRLEESRVNG